MLNNNSALPAKANNVRTYVTGVVAVLLLVYVAAFFATELKDLSSRTGETQWRFVVMLLLADPINLVAIWFGDPGQAGVLDRFPILVTAATIVVYAAILGWWLMSIGGVTKGLEKHEQLIFGTAIGLNVLSLFTLLVGLMGWLNPWCFAVPATATTVAALRRWSLVRRPVVGQPLSKTNGDGAWLSSRWLGLAAPAAAFLVLGGMLPPIDFDVREYHLQVPKEFYGNGQIGFLPHNVYAQMPLGAEMHALVGMVLLGEWWTGALVGKTVIAFVSVLTGAAVWSAGRRFFSPSVGVIAAVLYLWIPWVARVSMTGLIDGVVGCYAFLSLYAALIACGINSGSDDDQTIETTDRRSSTGWFLLAGFLAGASVACKYPALLLVVFPLTIGMGIHLGTRHHDLGARFKPLAAFLLAVAVGCGPWFVKNAVLTGNPTYPLLFEWFGGTSRTDELDRRWRQAHRPQPYPGSTDENAFSGRQVGYYVGHVLIRSAWLAPVLIPLAALALFAVSKTRRELVLLLLAYLAFFYMAWWIFTNRIDRFWVPALPVVALLAGIGATWQTSKAWRYYVIALLVLSSLYGMACMTTGVLEGSDRRFVVALSHLRNDPLRVDQAHLFLNKQRNVGTVLLVGDAQPFDLEARRVLYNTTFDSSVFADLVADRNAREFHKRLLAEGITYVYVHWNEIERYRSAGNYGFDERIRPEIFLGLLGTEVLQGIDPPDSEGRFWLYLVNPNLPNDPAPAK
ncbi:MAG TPA: hypothetical protein VMX74_06175 [Pirellulales bacterium]|nr:hypothetical protein [Pirellulales bacterium]